jgi:hypothetical protein
MTDPISYGNGPIGMVSPALQAQQYNQNLNLEHGGYPIENNQGVSTAVQNSFTNPTNLGTSVGQSAQYLPQILGLDIWW